MGCSSPVDTMKNMFLINEFNKKYLECDDNNTEIEIDSDKDNCNCYTFHKIGQKGFESFCKLYISSIQILYLSNNDISNIDCLKSFKAPLLLKLDLSHNKIKKINIFEKVNYPILKSLDLRNNIINDISIFINIFKDDSTKLKNIRIIELDNNDLDFNKPINKEILELIKNRMNKNKECPTTPDNSENYLVDELKNIKTLNDKYYPNENEITNEPIN